MRKVLFFIILLLPLLLLFSMWFGDSIKYTDEIKLAYDYLDPGSQKTIKNRKMAQVKEYTPLVDLEIMNEQKDKLINIKGKEVLKVTFKTENDGILGPITVYIDKNTNEVLGIGGRK